MAKRSHPPTSSKITEINLSELVSKAEPLAPGEPETIFANHAQFSINLNEIYIDFYRLEPNRKDPTVPHPIFVKRIVIPNSLGKGFATGMANLVAHYEKETGKILPNQRTGFPDDTISIWE